MHGTKKFNWDEYYKDVGNGVSHKERVKRRNSGWYDMRIDSYTMYDSSETKNICTENVDDIELYNQDIEEYGLVIVEALRRSGKYKIDMAK